MAVATRDRVENPTSGSAAWDVVDEAGFESFPASDPPGWGSHHAVASGSARDGRRHVVFAAADLRVRSHDVLQRAELEARARGCELVTGYALGWSARSILSRARACDAELIVIPGSDPGKIAARVVRRARCPVLVVRPPFGMHILVATDRSDADEPAIAAATEEARLLESPITAVSGAPVDAIVNAVTGIGADLVVVATRRRSALRRALHRSVAEAVARRAPCSVLVVRHR